MAQSTLTLKTATPYSLRYEYVNDGAGPSLVSKSQAQLVADAATATPGPGPLWELLSSITDTAVWDALYYNQQFELSVVVISQAAGHTVGVTFNNAGPALSMAVQGVNADACIAVIELHYRHTFNR